MSPGVHLDGRRGVEPCRHIGHAGKVRAAVTVDRVVRLQVRPPPLDLPLEPAGGPAEIAEPERDMVQLSERRDRVGHREAHLPLQIGPGEIRLRQLDRRIETLDRLHQIEGRTEDSDVCARGDERRMRNLATS